MSSVDFSLSSDYLPVSIFHVWKKCAGDSAYGGERWDWRWPFPVRRRFTEEGRNIRTISGERLYSSIPVQTVLSQTCSCSSIMIDDGSICMGRGLENVNRLFLGERRLPLLDCTRRTVSPVFLYCSTKLQAYWRVYGLYSVLFSVLVTCTVRHHWRLCCYELRVLPLFLSVLANEADF